MKKLLAWLLCLALCLSLFPAALAEDIEIVEPDAEIGALDDPSDEITLVGPESGPPLPDEPQTDANVKYRALLIAEVNYSFEVANRHRGDMENMRSMLTEVAGPEGNQFRVMGRINASAEVIRDDIASTFADADDNDVSLFFIATYGVTTAASGSYAGALVTVEEPDAAEAYLPLTALAEWLKAVPGKVVVVLGSSGSGAAVMNSGKAAFALDDSVEANARFNEAAIRCFASADDSLRAPGCAEPMTGEFRDGKFYVMTACGHQENCVGFEEQGFSLFPYLFAKGAGGDMPADSNGDETVTLNELYHYCHDTIIELLDGTGVSQNVQVYPANSSYPLFTKPGNSGSGVCGDHLTWTLDKAGKLIVSGTGEMWDFAAPDFYPPWDLYDMSVKEIVVQEGVTGIGNAAFQNCENLRKLSLPTSLTRIGFAGFAGCRFLPALTIPEAVTSIGGSAFAGCSSLSAVIVPEGVTELSDSVFHNCSSLESVTIPAGVTSIGDSAFYGCKSLTSVALPEAVTSIGDNVFFNCSSLTSVALPEAVTSIGDNVFFNCSSLTSVTLPEAVTSIGNYTFFNCSSLTSVMLPETLTSIGSYAFSMCGSLTAIEIPEGVTTLGEYVFRYCESLASVTIPGTVETMGFCDFLDCTALKTAGPIGADCDIRFGWTERIPDRAFSNSKLMHVTIPEGVTELGEKAFYWCGALKDVVFLGAPPVISADCFSQVTAAAWYPGEDENWTEEVRQDYGGRLTWLPLGEPLALSKSEIMLPVKDSLALSLGTQDGTVVCAGWSSSDENVATVDANGTVTALKYGRCTITAASGLQSLCCEVQTLFYDVADPNKYYFTPVYWAADMGITKGYDLEYFAPQEECRREQMMTFLWRMVGQPEPETETSSFSDVKKGSYYYKAVLWGVETGITNGYTSGEYAGKFGVGLACTREQAITFLWRLAGRPEPETAANPFPDVPANAYYCKAALWGAENEIAKGYSSGQYAGKYGVGLACLREHMVTFLYRYYTKFM